MFRRRKREESEEYDEDTAASEPADDAASSGSEPSAAETGGQSAAAPAEPGPWDSEDPPTEGLRRLDLGGLQVPVPDGVEVRVDVDPQGQVVAATVVSGSSAMQISAFAAPRSAGIWSEVRGEIVDSLRGTGGSAQEVEGPFGLELAAQVPAELPADSPGQRTVLAPARFIGVDGPRWFLRGLLTGPAAVDATAAAPLEALLRGVVVHRGKEAMAPRDALPLRLPHELVATAQAEQDNAQQGDQPSLDPFERGPEITEIY